MHAALRPSALLVALVTLTAPAVSAAQGTGRISGRVTDESGGALPGVTVTINSRSISPGISTITDGAGQYQSPDLRPDSYEVSFVLEGFETSSIPAAVVRAGESFILDRQLLVAPLAETVTVVAPAKPAAEVPRRVPPRPRPQVKPVPAEVLASVCGPGRPAAESAAIGHVVGHRDSADRQLFGNGDVLVLDAGAERGLAAGENFVVRRRFRIGDKSLPLKQASFGEQTAGLIQVVETLPQSAVAVVVYACGELMAGDSVEPFDAMPMWTAGEIGTPQFDVPGKVIFGDHGQYLGAPQQLMVIDQGATHGVQRGQRLTIFRRKDGDPGPVLTIADAIIVAVREDSATIRIENARDAVAVGDLVALHR
jgi:hypothetical protein